MRGISSLAVLATLVALSVALPSRVRIGARHNSPQGWAQMSSASPKHELEFVIALPQRNLDQLEQLYWDRTNPSSDNWRTWMTPKEILSLIAPEESVHERVLTWLRDNKVRRIESHSDSLRGVASVEVLTQMFAAPFFVFQHTSGARIVRALGSLSVPSSLTSCVVFVEGLTNFPVNHRDLHKRPITPNTKQRIQERGIWDWDSYIVPATLWNIYSIPPTTRITNPNSSQSVIEWEGQSFSPNDLKKYATLMGVPALNIPTQNHIIGPNDPTTAGDESTLDIEWIASTGLGGTNWFWLNGGQNSWLFGWAAKFFSSPSVPLINSISYGWAEDDQCADGIGKDECDKLKTDSIGYVTRVNVEFMKIGLRGVTLVVASGDSGCHGRTDESCTAPTFTPDFPAASPYVTSVGATQLRDVVLDLKHPPPVCRDTFYWFCASSGVEDAVSYEFASFASGGGFSNVAPRPSYQNAAVQSYLSSPQGQKVPKAYYNASGRAYPDISALGSAILIILGGSDTAIGGTSASAPIVAGVFALLNDHALNTDNKPLGPMNPLLYQWGATKPDAFTDVTVGDNSCTESGCFRCSGFYCSRGWDPVTGFGTPNYSKMLGYLTELLKAKAQ